MSQQPLPLMIGVSSRALFDMEDSNDIYESKGVAAYEDYQLSHENKPLPPGTAFKLVEKLLNLNAQDRINCTIMLVSRNSADTGLRILNSIEHYQLNITRATFTNGAKPYPYLKAFNANLFLSANEQDVKDALIHHCPAARILDANINRNFPDQLRIAFDGDAVLFSDEAEKIYQAHGLSAFSKNEKDKAKSSLQPGPLRPFLNALCAIQQTIRDNCPIRTALVTARSLPTHERVIYTLREWGIRLDEALFLGGLDKGEFLEAFGADIFFDDQPNHCASASKHVATGHVPSGIMNEAEMASK